MSNPSWQPILRLNYGLELTLDVHELPSADWIIAWRRLATATHAHGWQLRDSEAEQVAWIKKTLLQGYRQNLYDAWRPPSLAANPERIAGGIGSLHVRVADRLRLLEIGLAIGRAAGFRLAALAALDWALSPQFSNPYDPAGGPPTLSDPAEQALLQRVACQAACASAWPRSGLGAALDERPRLTALLRLVNCPAIRR